MGAALKSSIYRRCQGSHVVLMESSTVTRRTSRPVDALPPTLPLPSPPLLRLSLRSFHLGCCLFPFTFFVRLISTFSPDHLVPSSTHSIDSPPPCCHFYPLCLLSWMHLLKHYPRGCRTRPHSRQVTRESQPRPSPQLSTSL